MEEKYLMLRAHLYNKEDGKECAISLGEVSEICHCTTKTAKRLIQKYNQSGRLEYQPGNGRGNTSKIIFKKSFQSEVEDYIIHCLNKENVQAILNLLNLPIPRGWVAKYSANIRDLFGIRRNDYARDILHTFKPRQFTTLDPLKVTVTSESHLVEQLGDTLVKYDAERDCIIPHIAHHYNVDSSHKVWTFYLRKGVYFHDNELLTSHDVQGTIDRIKKGPSFSTWLTDNICKVECEAPDKIMIYLTKPNRFFLRYLSSIQFSILPVRVRFNEYEWIGSGPFLLKERTKDKLVLEAFEGYFKERPLLDEIHFHTVSKNAMKKMNFTIDDSSSSQSFQSYEVDNGFRFLAFNLNRPGNVCNEDFRTAIYHIINPSEMIRQLGDSTWTESSSFLRKRSKNFKRDVELVPHLLRKSNYKGEKLNLFHLNYPHTIKEANWTASELMKFGINVELIPYKYSDNLGENMDSSVDMILMGEVSSQDSQFSFIEAFQNDTRIFRNILPDKAIHWIDDKLEEMLQLENTTEREMVISEIENYIRDKHYLLFLYHQRRNKTLHHKIEDVDVQSFGHFDYKKLWINF